MHDHLFQSLFATPMWKRMYMAHLRTILEEQFASQAYATRAEAMMATISDAVEADTKKFFTFAQFQNSLDQTATGGFGSGTPGIRQLMAGRLTAVQANAEFKKHRPRSKPQSPATKVPRSAARLRSPQKPRAQLLSGSATEQNIP